MCVCSSYSLVKKMRSAEFCHGFVTERNVPCNYNSGNSGLQFLRRLIYLKRVGFSTRMIPTLHHEIYINGTKQSKYRSRRSSRHWSLRPLYEWLLVVLFRARISIMSSTVCRFVVERIFKQKKLLSFIESLSTI